MSAAQVRLRGRVLTLQLIDDVGGWFFGAAGADALAGGEDLLPALLAGGVGVVLPRGWLVEGVEIVARFEQGAFQP